MENEFSVSILLRCEPSEAFAFLAEPANAPLIDPAVISYTPKGGVMGEGVRNYLRFRMMGIPMTAVSETTGWDPPRRMEFVSVETKMPVVATAEHLLEACEGGTRYTWSMTFRPSSALGKLVAPISCHVFRRNADKSLQKVQRALDH